MLTMACPSARIDVASTVVRLALRFVVSDHGWSECSHGRPCSCLSVADRVPGGADVLDVFVVRDEPAACQEAVDAAMGSRVRSVVLWNEPEGLIAACDSLQRQMAVIPLRVLELAAMAPKLSVRQRETLRLLARGLEHVDRRCVAAVGVDRQAGHRRAAAAVRRPEPDGTGVVGRLPRVRVAAAPSATVGRESSTDVTVRPRSARSRRQCATGC